MALYYVSKYTIFLKKKIILDQRGRLFPQYGKSIFVCLLFIFVLLFLQHWGDFGVFPVHLPKILAYKRIQTFSPLLFLLRRATCVQKSFADSQWLPSLYSSSSPKVHVVNVPVSDPMVRCLPCESLILVEEAYLIMESDLFYVFSDFVFEYFI